jgi:NTP pyrophosphatase (non-canonical NTP hydrolase)
MTELAALQSRISEFARERDWEQFHAPKNLVMALMVEAAELAEHFQWMTPEESEAIGEDRLPMVREELADVFIYLLRLADRLQVDLVEAASDKLLMNARKYPPERARGTSRKYTEL